MPNVYFKFSYNNYHHWCYYYLLFRKFNFPFPFVVKYCRLNVSFPYYFRNSRSISQTMFVDPYMYPQKKKKIIMHRTYHSPDKWFCNSIAPLSRPLQQKTLHPLAKQFVSEKSLWPEKSSKKYAYPPHPFPQHCSTSIYIYFQEPPPPALTLLHDESSRFEKKKQKTNDSPTPGWRHALVPGLFVIGWNYPKIHGLRTIRSPGERVLFRARGVRQISKFLLLASNELGSLSLYYTYAHTGRRPGLEISNMCEGGRLQ